MESEQNLVKNTPELVDFATKANAAGFSQKEVVSLVKFFEIRNEYKKLDQMGNVVDQDALLNNLEEGKIWLENHMSQPKLIGWFFVNY